MFVQLLCVHSNRDPKLLKHECLHPDELPTLGTLVAIDAEFVSMQQVSCLFALRVAH